MRLAPFVPDMVERAAKSYIIGESTYVFEGLISTGWRSWEWWAGAEFGVGSAVGSAVLSWLSLRYVLTWRWPFVRKAVVKTASLAPRVEYAPPA